MLEVEVNRNADGDFTIRMITNTTGWNIEEGWHDKLNPIFCRQKCCIEKGKSLEVKTWR